MGLHIEINVTNLSPSDPVRVGNVYACRGGRRMSLGQMMVVIAITKPTDRYDAENVLLLIIDQQGEPRGVTHYGLHYLEDKTPIAFVDGLEDLRFTMRSL